MFSGIMMLEYALYCIIENADLAAIMFRQSCLFFGYIFLLVPLSYLYIHASSNHEMMKSSNDEIIKSSDLKILDWALIIFVLCLMSLFEIVDPSLLFWFLFVVLPAVMARILITWYLKRKS
jgi:hypothetical protein